MIRDRFEKLIDAISTGKALTETRSRFEEVINAIATKIGELSEGGSGGGSTRTLLGEFETAQTTCNVEDMSDYNSIIIEFAQSDRYGAYSGIFTTEALTFYELSKIVTTVGTSSAAGGNMPFGCVLTSSTSITNIGFGNGYIRRVWGVK